MTVIESVYAAIQWLRDQRHAGSVRPWTIAVPACVPYVPLLLRFLPLAEVRGVEVRVPGGVPFRGTGAYPRWAAFHAALAGNLSAEHLAALLPYLRRGLGDRPPGVGSSLPRIAPSRALALLHATGADARDGGPTRWAARIEALLARATSSAASAAKKSSGDARRLATVARQRWERVARELRPIVPALRELDTLADLLGESRTADELIEPYLAFARRWLAAPLRPSEWQDLERKLRAWAQESSGAVRGRGFVTAVHDVLGQLAVEPEPVEAPDVIVTTAVPPASSGPVFSMQRASDEDAYAAGVRVDRPIERGESHSRAGDLLFDGDDTARKSTTRSQPSAPLAPAGTAVVTPDSLRGLGACAERPLSATALPMLLACPYRFLLERVAHVHPVPTPTSTGSLDSVAAGILVHTAAARCLAQFGNAFAQREGRLEDWLEAAEQLVAATVAEVLVDLPLWGEAVQEEALAQVRNMVQQLLASEWRQPPSKFVAVEWRFGEPQGVEVTLATTPVFVRGAIDWVVQAHDDGMVVRELKTATGGLAARSRVPARQLLQLGAYVLALESARVVDAPVARAELVLLGPDGVRRACLVQGSLCELRERTGRALEVARNLIDSGLFPRTPAASDCARCPFLAHCGEDAAARSAQALAATSNPALADFLRWRTREALEFEAPLEDA